MQKMEKYEYSNIENVKKKYMYFPSFDFVFQVNEKATSNA